MMRHVARHWRTGQLKHLLCLFFESVSANEEESGRAESVRDGGSESMRVVEVPDVDDRDSSGMLHLIVCAYARLVLARRGPRQSKSCESADLRVKKA